MLSTSPEPVPFTLDQHGTARIGGSRLTLDTVITAYKNGASAEQITRQFPPVELADVHFAIGYYLRRRDEVDDYLQEGLDEAEKIRFEMESRYGTPEEVRARLLARSRQLL